MRKLIEGLGRHTGLLFFLALYAVFLHPLMRMEMGFLGGDYQWQFYPWTRLFADAMKNGTLPLWTPDIQSGFPLFAEGQTAMLYPLNLFFFSVFPFDSAYNLLFLTHFLMGGAFAYLFARKRRLGREAASLTAITFTFGSAYAGCFYNVVTLRTLVWFPLALYFVEDYLETGKALPLFLLTLALAQSWLGGFAQTAAYAFGFVALYYFLEAFWLGRARSWPWRRHLLFLGALGLSVLIALPQLWATLEFAFHSTRVLHEKSFIFWGSVPPWSLATLFLYPWSVFLRANLYIGVLPFLLIVALGRETRFKTGWALTLLSFLLAMGVFNPLYWVLVHLPGISLLRNPSKFLFFTAFFLSVIAGEALDTLFKRGAGKRILAAQAKVSAFFFALALGGWALARWGAPYLLKFGDWYVNQFVMNKTYHRWSHQVYEDRVRALLGVVQSQTDFSNPVFWTPFVFAGASMALLHFYRKGMRREMFTALFLFLLCTDLFIYGKLYYGTGFIGNLKHFATAPAMEGFARDGKWLDLAEGDDLLFPPNRNLLSGHAQAGAYSPLLDKSYYLLTHDWGNLDDSFGRGSVDPSAPGRQKRLLDFAGVKYIHAPASSGLPFRRLKGNERAVVYVNPEAQPEFTLVFKTHVVGKESDALEYLKGSEFNPAVEAIVIHGPALEGKVSAAGAELTVLSQEAQRAKLKTDGPVPALLVRNQTYDKGWRATVDGFAVPLVRVNVAFQGIELTPGPHDVEFVFLPDSFIIGRWFYAIGLTVALAGALVSALYYRRKHASLAKRTVSHHPGL